jgi:apolipoprotein D and lipocalin family protein
MGLLVAALGGCVSLPVGIEPVSNFEQDRYLGKWYEIARLDHGFERGLTQVSAHYSLQEDGSILVLNRGYSTAKDQWKEARGRAKFVGSTDSGHLKVSFFGPFYGSYVIFELDAQGYEYAFVCGPNRKYLWLLARTPQVSEALQQRFLSQAEALGFDTRSLIWVEQG